MPTLPLEFGTLIIGLTPALPSSVAPSGMVPPETPPAPVEDGDIPGAPEAEPEDAVEQAPDIVPAAPAPLIPPPSKLELVPGVDIPPDALAMP